MNKAVVVRGNAGIVSRMIASLLLLASALAEPGLQQLLAGPGLEGFGRSATAYIELDIDAQGRVERCRVLDPGAPNRPPVRRCPALEGRTVVPAHLSSGQPVPARLRMVIPQRPTSSASAPVASASVEPADLELTTKGLPHGAKSIQTKVVVEIGNVGQVEDCKASSAVTNPKLTAPACSAFRRVFFAPMIGREGRPVTYVTTQIVRFTAP